MIVVKGGGTAMRAGDGGNETEPKAVAWGRATVFEAGKACEHPLAIACRNAGAMIGDGENHLVALPRQADRGRGADRRVVQPIVEQIDSRLCEQFAIALDGDARRVLPV
jgi:hypothetical protein